MVVIYNVFITSNNILIVLFCFLYSFLAGIDVLIDCSNLILFVLGLESANLYDIPVGSFTSALDIFWIIHKCAGHAFQQLNLN